MYRKLEPLRLSGYSLVRNTVAEKHQTCDFQVYRRKDRSEELSAQPGRFFKRDRKSYYHHLDVVCACPPSPQSEPVRTP